MNEVKQRMQDVVDRDRTHECAGFGRHSLCVRAVAVADLPTLDVRSVRVMTNNPNKLEQLKGYGISVTGRSPHVLPPNEHNRSNLETKGKRSGHFINFGAEQNLTEQSDVGILPDGAE